MSVNVRARATSFRNVAFFWLDSIRVTDTFGAQSFMGMPGKPAPEPMSATRSLVVGRWSLANSKAESKPLTTEDTEDTQEDTG